MDDKRQQAVSGAKDAALQSVSFIITGTAKEAKQMRSAALQAAKGAVAVRKAVTTLAGKFQTINKQIAQIKDTVGKAGDPTAKLVRVRGILDAGGDAYKEAENVAEEGKADISALSSSTAGAVGKAALSLGALAMAIPFLLSPEVREMIMGFFNGFLEGLGISTEAMGTARVVLGATVAVLGLYFTGKALAPVVDAFNKMKELAGALGLAGEKVAAEKASIDADKDAIKKGAEGASDDLKKTKGDLKKGKKIGSKWNPKTWIDKFKFLGNKIGPAIKRIAGNLLKAIPFLGTFISLGFIIADLWDIGSAIYDMFTGDADDKDEEATQESAPAPSGSTAAPPEPASAAAPEAKPAAASTAAEPPESGTSTPAPGPAASAPTALPTINAAAETLGSAVDAASVAVQQADVDAFKTQGNINIVNMMNSTIVVDAKESKPTPREAPVFSVTVGT